jgi:hypothetical protein
MKWILKKLKIPNIYIIVLNKMSEIVWISLDPVARKVITYPKVIANRIEKSYRERDPYNSSSCILGPDFYNATIHFHPSGVQYQTTPGLSLGRAGVKRPGYRSVKRCHVVDGTITIFAKEIGNELRITHNESDSERTYVETPSQNDIIITDNLEENITIDTWNGNDLNSTSLDTLVVVWQWCQHTHGDVSKYSDAHWRPYSSDINTVIERAFNDSLMSIKITLPIIGDRNIRFNQGSCYASQVSLDNRRNRSVRRVVKTIQELKQMFSYIATLPQDYSAIVNNLPEGEVPHHYCCPILQEIMTDPVKTIDGFTYERNAIQTWFNVRVTSPLTGLPLASTTLVPNKELAEAIADFIKRVNNASINTVLT